MCYERETNPTTDSSTPGSASAVSVIINDLGSVQDERVKPLVVSRRSYWKKDEENEFVYSYFTRLVLYKTKSCKRDYWRQSNTTFLCFDPPFFFFTHTNLFSHSASSVFSSVSQTFSLSHWSTVLSPSVQTLDDAAALRPTGVLFIVLTSEN